MPNGANEFTIEELESLFNDENQQATPPAQETTETRPAEDTSEPVKENDVTTTKAFATRLKESTTKARLEEREAIAKTFGYESYDAMVKARERKTYEEKGLDPDEVSPVVDELVKQRLNDDPRMQELEEFRKQQILEFGKKELAEITRLTGGQVTKFDQLPKSVIDLWQKEGSLKSAYLKIEGERLINNIRSGQTKGSTEHLGGLNGSPAGNSNMRPLTEREKQMWRFFNPKITDEELNKKTVEKT